MSLRINNAWLCQVISQNVVPVFADIIISDDRIESVIPKDFSGYSFASVDHTDKEYDARGRVVTIPNVNFHDHIYSRLAKGLQINGSMENFHEVLKNLWWKLDLALDLDMVKASAEMAAIESIRNGVLYIFDHHASPNHTSNSLKTIADVLNKYGLRGTLCFETSDRNGDALKNAAIEENVQFAKDYCDENIKSMFGIHASFTVNDDTLETIQKIREEIDVGIHVHLCEDAVDNIISHEKYEQGALDRLSSFNLLDDKTILAHGIHLSVNDFNKINNAGSAIAYNPDSNLNNAVGLPEYFSVPSYIPILCGTDGMHANVMRTFKQLFLQFRHQKNSFESTFERAHNIYFEQINFVKRYFPDFTSLHGGDRADMIIWDYVPPTPFNESNFFGHLVYGISERHVCSALAKGKFLMKDYNSNIDEGAVSKEIFLQGSRLAKAFEKLH